MDETLSILILRSSIVSCGTKVCGDITSITKGGWMVDEWDGGRGGEPGARPAVGRGCRGS